MVLLSQDLIPVEYALPEPWQFEIGKDEYWTVFSMCSNPPYQNCWIRTRVNMPHLAWDVPSGAYVNLEVFSYSGGQCTLVVQNDIHSTSPQIADFLYRTGGGSEFYVRLSNNVATGLQGTLDVRIDCDGATSISYTKKIVNDLVIPCGQAATMMSMAYRPTKPINFITAQSFADWLQLKIPVCLGGPFHGLRYRAQATDTQSAASSRACTNSPCDAAANVAVDRSGSALNQFDIPNFNNRTLYLALEGWGNFKEQNSFLISLSAME